MATWDQWLPELQLCAANAPVPLIHQCLNRAARNFLRETRLWQEWLEPIDVTGVPLQEFAFELPQGAELVRLERATIDGKPLEVVNARDLPSDPWRHTQGGAYLVSTDMGNFTVVIQGSGGVQVYVSLVPTLRATGVPDHIAGNYHEAIREGAKAELLNIPGTQFAAPDQAAVALAYFRQACDRGVTDVWRSSTGRTSRGRPRWL